MWFDDEDDEDKDDAGRWEVEEISTAGDVNAVDAEVVDERTHDTPDPDPAPDDTDPKPAPDDTEGRESPSTGRPAEGPDSGPLDGGIVAPTPGVDTPTVDYPRGTFVFPGDDKGFLQLLELRGQNGASETVETVYVLTGDNYWQPTRLFALHDPELYNFATVKEVESKIGAMAQRIASQLDEPPKMLAYVHTHPSGSTTPSRKDRIGVQQVRETFATTLGMDDYEYFHVIHGLGGEVKGLEVERRSPTRSGSGVYWYGEYRRHDLAVFDTDYTPVEVRLR